ncbi:MAG: hypothetical protein ABII89_01355 [Candidatus Omnitrophota bacterium]
MKNGYSLLVVIIALVIFATGIISILSLMPSGHQAVSQTVFYSRAAAIAEKEISLIRVRYSGEDSPPPPAEISGEDLDGFRWTAAIEKDGGMYFVSLDVYWKEGGKEEKETFETRFVKK